VSSPTRSASAKVAVFGRPHDGAGERVDLLGGQPELVHDLKRDHERVHADPVRDEARRVLRVNESLPEP
jgi:hypothetical protein